MVVIDCDGHSSGSSVQRSDSDWGIVVPQVKRLLDCKVVILIKRGWGGGLSLGWFRVQVTEQCMVFSGDRANKHQTPKEEKSVTGEESIWGRMGGGGDL